MTLTKLEGFKSSGNLPSEWKLVRGEVRWYSEEDDGSTKAGLHFFERFSFPRFGAEPLLPGSFSRMFYAPENGKLFRVKTSSKELGDLLISSANKIFPKQRFESVERDLDGMLNKGSETSGFDSSPYWILNKNNAVIGAAHPAFGGVAELTFGDWENHAPCEFADMPDPEPGDIPLTGERFVYRPYRGAYVSVYAYSPPERAFRAVVGLDFSLSGKPAYARKASLSAADVLYGLYEDCVERDVAALVPGALGKYSPITSGSGDWKNSRYSSFLGFCALYGLSPENGYPKDAISGVKETVPCAVAIAGKFGYFLRAFQDHSASECARATFLGLEDASRRLDFLHGKDAAFAALVAKKSGAIWTSGSLRVPEEKRRIPLSLVPEGSSEDGEYLRLYLSELPKSAPTESVLPYDARERFSAIRPYSALPSYDADSGTIKPGISRRSAEEEFFLASGFYPPKKCSRDAAVLALLTAPSSAAAALTDFGIRMPELFPLNEKISSADLDPKDIFESLAAAYAERVLADMFLSKPSPAEIYEKLFASVALEGPEGIIWLERFVDVAEKSAKARAWKYPGSEETAEAEKIRVAATEIYSPSMNI